MNRGGEDVLKNIPRIVIAATQSGAGKTTIVSGLLASLRAMGVVVQSYKIGPDYIDPGYHELASGRAAHNLDTWLVPALSLNSIFAKTMESADLAIIEGVMGLYDGGSNGISSTAAIAKQLAAPVILVIDAKSMGDSAAAIALGFREYDRDVNICGVLLNRVGSSSHETLLREAMARISMPVVGCIRRDTDLQLPERHLGLTPVSENAAERIIEKIGKAIGEQVSLPLIQAIAEAAPPLPTMVKETLVKKFKTCRIAVARDEAFTFYYPESLAVLADYGAEITFFSPLHDVSLPIDVDGIIIGGGFPEMFASDLAKNTSLREEIAVAAKRGMPVYAECGGLMYLTQSLTDFSGKAYAMAGVVPAKCVMHNKLQSIGYIEAEALTDNLLCKQGERLRGHEFHFSTMQVEKANQASFPWAFIFRKKRTGAEYVAGFVNKTILASYLHIHFAGNLPAAKRFTEKCIDYRLSRASS